MGEESGNVFFRISLEIPCTASPGEGALQEQKDSWEDELLWITHNSPSPLFKQMKRPNLFPWKSKELRLVTEQTTIICFFPFIQESSIQTLQEHFQSPFILLINKPCAAVLSGLQSTNPLLNQPLITEFIRGASHGAERGRLGRDLLLVPSGPAEGITGLLLDTDWAQAQG